MFESIAGAGYRTSYILRYVLQNVRKLTFKAPILFILFSVKRNGRKWANAPFKKTILHFAPLPKLIREMSFF